MNIEIYEEEPADFEAAQRVIVAAFEGRIEEPRLVRLMRERGQGLISLVAKDSSELIGHVMVSPITLVPGTPLYLGAVAPLCVLPRQQTRGIGSKLMSAVIQKANAIGLDALFLLGSPKYYPRFGFSASHIDNEYGATDAFMHLEISPGCLAKLQSKAYYVSAFNEVGA